jgi:large subunit ribosomal protein L29
MKNSEITGLSQEELVAKVAEQKENLVKLKFAHTISAIENPTRIRKVRRDIARLNTEMTMRNAQPATETN